MKSFLPEMALKNILRNKRRTTLSGSTIALVAMSICLLLSLEEGAITDMKKNIIDGTTGNIRIQNEKYTQNLRIMPLQFYVPNTNKIVSTIEALDEVQDVEKHILSTVSIYHKDQITTASLMGLTLSSNRLFKDTSTTVLEGTLPKIVHSDRLAVITQSLSSTLNIHAGDKFTFFTRTATGGTNGSTVTVAAVIYLGNTDYNGMQFFMDWQELSQILRMGGNAQSLLIYTKTNFPEKNIASLIHKISNLSEIHNLTNTQLEIKKWQQVSTLFELFSMVDIIYFFIALVFFILAATVIFNTTMMSVLERQKEMGTLMALGMEKHTITRLILIETALTAGLAATAGTILSSLIIHYLGTTGFDLNAMGGNAVNGMNMSAWLYPHLSFYRYLWVASMGTVISVIACIGPARLALRIEPAEALRTGN
jgi:putative ABC transport system permease protein